MRRWKYLCSMVAVIGTAAALGCNGSVEASSEGTGGNGGQAEGAGGNGGAADGSGGNGGPTEGGGGHGTTGVPTGSSQCATEYEKGPTEEVGFGHEVDFDAAPMVVETVEPGALVLKSQDAELIPFAWTGQDLTEIFSVGQVVTVSAASLRWGSVATDTAFVAAYYYDWWSYPLKVDPTPHGGPSFTFAPACEGQLDSYFDLVATLGDEKVTVQSHETVSVGDYVVRNGGVLGWQYQSESGRYVSIQVVGPLPVP